MGIISVLYAAFGYLALLAALFWGMLFVGDGSILPNIDRGIARPLPAMLVDLALLALLALVHRSVGRALLPRSMRFIPSRLARCTAAWALALTLVVIYCAWQPVPETLWSASGSTEIALSAIFFVAWTLIFIGVFLASHLDLFEIGHRLAPSALPDLLRQPMYAGILLAVWAAPVMTAGRLLLAGSISTYLVFDGLLQARHARAPGGELLLQGQRVAR
jgi:methanethiol S-methyltransferase